MAVPLVDLGRMPREYGDATRAAIDRVLTHRQFVLGDEVRDFEAAMGEHLGVPCLGVSSGTDALLLGLLTLGIGPGDEVLTTPFSFLATAGVIARVGARPRFLDIDPTTFELDITRLEEVERGDIRAIMPVHLFGHVMDLDPVFAWAGDDVVVFEDAAQALGAKDAAGRPGGTRGALAGFSFFPTKNLGAFGDAGLLAVGDPEVYERARRLRSHGQVGVYRHEEVGGNFRLDALQAAVLGAALPFLDGFCATRRRNAQGYLARLEAAGLLDGRVVPPRCDANHSMHQFVVRIPGGRRDAVREGLKERGIGSAVYYPIPFHLQPCFRDLGFARGDFPQAERAAEEVLALPIFPGLTAREIDEVVEALQDLA